jgi:outer membrane protein assembly factor BamA
MLAALLFIGSAGNAQQLSVKPLIGGFPADSGFALGGAISRTHLAGPIEAHAKGIVSVKKYQLYEIGAGIPELGRWLSFDLSSRYSNFPQEDFWGLGPNTPQSARSNYLLEDVDTTATLSASAGGFRAGVNAGRLRINTGRGRDRKFPSVPEPLQSSPRFTHIGGFFEYESLDEAADPHTGGKYSFQWTAYASSFQRYVVDLRRFIPVTSADRIGLRLQTSFTRSSPKEEVPFFMLPTAGGTDTVRGFNQYRFRDRNALVLNSEYRRPLADFLELVAFADAGRVFSRSSDLGLRDLHPAAGIGARVKFGSRVFFGIDLGFSGEGRKLWFRSDHMF